MQQIFLASLIFFYLNIESKGWLVWVSNVRSCVCVSLIESGEQMVFLHPLHAAMASCASLYLALLV